MTNCPGCGRGRMSDWALGAPEVFVSYARAGQHEIAARLHQRITAAGWIALRDVDDIPAGTRWRGTIHGWLDSCDVAVVLRGAQALGSPWVQDEVSVLAHRFFRPGADLDALLLVHFGDVELAGLGQGRLGAANAPQIESREVFPVAPDPATRDAIVEAIIGHIHRILATRPGAGAGAGLRHRAAHHARARLPAAADPLRRMCGTLAGGRRLPEGPEQLAALAAVEWCRAGDPLPGHPGIGGQSGGPGRDVRARRPAGVGRVLAPGRAQCRRRPG